MWEIFVSLKMNFLSSNRMVRKSIGSKIFSFVHFLGNKKLSTLFFRPHRSALRDRSVLGDNPEIWNYIGMYDISLGIFLPYIGICHFKLKNIKIPYKNEISEWRFLLLFVDKIVTLPARRLCRSLTLKFFSRSKDHMHFKILFGFQKWVIFAFYICSISFFRWNGSEIYLHEPKSLFTFVIN